MNTVIHKADSRGFANHGWLKAYHTFSFAGYYNPERIHFGMLRVLNDDIIEAGMGFGTHPHENMEIITIPIEGGGIEHIDSMGNQGVIHKNEIQVMSAGSGIQHSEFNASKSENTNLLQIWIFPNQKNVEPRYDQLLLNPEDRENRLQQILSPDKEDEGVWIHQDVWFHITRLNENKKVRYHLKNKENGVYVFIINGNLSVAGHQIESRDGIGIWETENFDILAKSNAEVLIMEVPMR